MLLDKFEPIVDDSEELSLEAVSQILEGYMLDNLSADEVEEFIRDHQEVYENVRNEILTEKTIVRFDKMAKLSRAKQVAIFTVAKERKDPLFRRLLTLWRMERYIEARLAKKYGNEAMRRARKSVAIASKKPSKTMKKVIDRAAVRAKRQLNALKDTHAQQLITRIQG